MQRLEQIIANNERRVTYGGMSGALQVFENLTSPGHYKRLAASYLIAHRKCVISNRDYFKRKYRGTYWLDKAANARRQAFNLTK